MQNASHRQPAFPGAVGERGHPAVVGVAASVVDCGGDPRLAGAAGQQLADRAKEAGITAAVFDRGGYAYHGRVAALADGAREGGLTL